MTIRVPAVAWQRASTAGDPLLVFAVLALGAVGLLSLEGAVRSSGNAGGEVLRHAALVGVGLLVLVVTARIDYRVWRPLAGPLYVGGLALLMVVLVAGSEEFGARRWVVVAGYSLQPSELAKLTTIIATAAWISSRGPTLRAFLVALGALALCAGLVLAEPDLGGGLLLVAAWMALMVAWPLSPRALGTIATAALAVVPMAFALAVPAYQRERLAVFFDPGRDPLGSGFTLRQVEVALAEGGLTGRGLDATGSALAGIATRGSDFALAQLGEQFGAVGALFVLAAYGVIAWRGFAIAERAPDRFGALLAAGLTALVVVQATLHVAVNVRMFPATGIPLPLVSLGGSSLVATCAAAGLLLSIATRSRTDPFERWSEAPRRH